MALAGLVLLACGQRPARFKTSDAPPETKDPSLVVPFSPPVSDLPSPKSAMQRAAERFIWALENGSSGQLARVLTSDAIVREQSSGASSPALSGLIEMSNAWTSGIAIEGRVPQSKANSSEVLFGPAEVTQLEAHERPVWVTIAVDGPPEVRGSWKMRFDESGPEPLIQEVVIPKSH